MVAFYFESSNKSFVPRLKSKFSNQATKFYKI